MEIVASLYVASLKSQKNNESERFLGHMEIAGFWATVSTDCCQFEKVSKIAI